MALTIMMVLGGLVLLTVGGELLVRGAVSISTRLGLPTVVTGVVIVGAATSMPELVTSVDAALMGSPGIAWGNIVGSNIANSLLILGAVALLFPFPLTGAGKRDAVVGLIASVLLAGIAFAGLHSIGIGIFLLAALATYVLWRVTHPRKTEAVEEDGQDGPQMALILAIALFLVGVGALVTGGHLLVEGAVEIARVAGVSEVAIGATVVAVGTSLPELAASVAAAWRGQPGLALGNVVGSNAFNLLLIGGVTMTIAPLAIPVELLDIEWPLLVASAALLLGLCAFAKRAGRALGALLLAAFAANSVLLFA